MRRSLSSSTATTTTAIAAIHRQAASLKKRAHRDARKKHDENFRVGIEIEACLVDHRGGLVDAGPLIKAFHRSRHKLDYEYARCQFEFKTEHVSMHDLADLNARFEEFIEQLDKKINKVYPNEQVIPVFLGANPSSAILSYNGDWVTDKPRYRRLAKWQSSHISNVEIEGKSIKALHAAYAIQGFHFHLQGRDPDYTAEMFNHILNLIPAAILLGANSRLLAGRIFSMHEPRIYLYDQTEQQNSGFPAISKYLRNVDDYIDYIISRKPIIAKNYFEMVKERHDDARIRLNGPGYRVETRIMSVQPTPKALMAMIEFFTGYLYRAIHESRELRPLASLREERQSVIRSGFHAKTHFNIIDTVRHHLAFAHKGLQDLGVKKEFLSILDRRLENKTSPGDYVARLWESKFNGSINDTVAEVANHIWQRTKSNNPIT